MRLPVVASAILLTVSGCLGPVGEDLEPESVDTPNLVGALVHRAGASVDVDAAAVLGDLPRFVEHLLGTPGGEPTLGVTSTGGVFVNSHDKVWRSFDGEAWEMVYAFGLEGYGIEPDPMSNTDPYIWVDQDTDRVFHSPMWPILTCSYGAMSDDDGATWQEVPYQCGQPGVDHQKLATGPFVDGGVLQPTADYPTAVYYCYNKLVSTNCAVSLDGGVTFPIERVVSENSPCAGVNGQPAAAPDGTVFVPAGDLNGGCDRAVVYRSTDNGLTWDVIELKTGGLGQEEINPEVTVTPDGTAYYVFRASVDHRLYMVRSTDGFDTTDGPFLVSAPELTSTRFAAVASGDDGRLAVAYLATSDTTARPVNAEDDTRWYLHVTYTVDAADGEPTFVTVQVSPDDDPIQIGYMWEAGGGDPARNLLDFMDAQVGPDGRVWIAYTDGCTEDCAGVEGATKHDSRARDTGVAVMVEGPSLFLA